MNDFLQVLMTALAALTVENALFSGGIGFGKMLRAARRPRQIRMHSLLVAWFSLISILLGSVLNPVIQENEVLQFMRPALYALFTAAAYLLFAFLVKAFLPKFHIKYGELLAPAAINTVVLAMPYVQKAFKLSPFQAVGYALGTGAAFYLGSLILAGAALHCKDEECPKAFAGLPSLLIYIGILSLAFAGFTGAKLF
ncbi:Rnf-Nqr domain containing protein [Caproiciproducens sp. LBM24188]|jgi:electron transport complex protein RnfA|nr:hypothetical protein [Oscillospiraceae bacterium]HHV30846.1 hypothetical protein [Clostridiales bacterium]